MTAVPRRLRQLAVALRYVGASRFSAASLLPTGRRAARIPAVNRLMNMVISAVLAGVAVELLVEARLGLTPFDALAFGVGERFGLTLGQSGWLLAGLLFALATILGRRPGPWGMGYIFACGLTIDAAAGLVAPTDALTTRIALLAGGILTMAACVGVILNSDMGGGPAELLMLAGRDRGLPMVVGRMMFDVGIVLGAVLVGGPVAIGTFAHTALMGPTIQVVNQAFVDHRAGRERRLAERTQVPAAA